jgi:hypothetical protein
MDDCEVAKEERTGGFKAEGTGRAVPKQVPAGKIAGHGKSEWIPPRPGGARRYVAASI